MKEIELFRLRFAGNAACVREEPKAFLTFFYNTALRLRILARAQAAFPAAAKIMLRGARDDEGGGSSVLGTRFGQIIRRSAIDLKGCGRRQAVRPAITHRFACWQDAAEIGP